MVCAVIATIGVIGRILTKCEVLFVTTVISVVYNVFWASGYLIITRLLKDCDVI